MAYYAFKLNPKQAVEARAKSLYGRDAKVKVLGRRLTAEECTSMGEPKDSYLTQCVVNGKVVAAVVLRDWRLAYKKLVDEVVKAHSQESVTQAVQTTLP